MSAAGPQADSALLGALRPFAGGSYDLQLVVDDAPSMEMWHENVAQFAMMTRRASFRGVRVHRLDTSAPGALLCTEDGGRPTLASDVLGYRADGRVLLLATDGVGAAWRDGRMTQLLHMCVAHTPLAVMQVLPQRLWFRTGSPIVDVEWCADGPGTPTAALRRRPPLPPAAGPWPHVDDAVPLIGFDLTALKTWAELIAVGGGAWHQGLGLRLIAPPSPSPAAPPAGGQDLVRRFQRTAERDSIRLAALLTVAPVVTVPLLRGMQRRLLPDRGDFPVAETFLSGLLTPASVSGAVTGRAYVFQPEVAETLKATLLASETQRALKVAEEFLPSGAWETVRLPPPAPPEQRTESVAAPSGPELTAAWQYLPSRNSHFTGREVLLRKLRSALTAGADQPCVLYGTGGMGKSQTALEYAYRHQGDYDFVWWVEAADPVQVTQSLEELGTALGIAPGPSGAPPLPAVLDRLRRGRVRKGWLLVLDNAESPDGLGRLIPHGNGHVIITSRRLSWTKQVPHFVPVPPFERAESLALLRRLVPELPEPEAHALSERAGDLPLAILQIGRFLSDVDMDMAVHLAEFDELCAMLLQQDGLLDYPVPLVASWQATLEALVKDMPAAVHLFHLLCHLGVGPVPQDLLFAAVGSAMPSGPGAVLSRRVGLHEALRRLCDAGLATVDTAIHEVEVHRVLQLVARQRFMDPQERRQADEAVLCLLAAAVPQSPTAPGARRRMTEIVRRLNLVPALASERPEVNDLVIAAVRHYKDLGDLDAAHVAAELAERNWRTGSRARPDRLEVIRRCLDGPSHTA